jgi:hypothetical protein
LAKACGIGGVQRRDLIKRRGIDAKSAPAT